ncbi:MAG: hypothetical protein ACI9WU_002178 [Myxococcota bacterium]|jgi:hypothetical protein
MTLGCATNFDNDRVLPILLDAIGDLPCEDAVGIPDLRMVSGTPVAGRHWLAWLHTTAGGIEWEVDGLPTGVVLSADGVLSGTPLEAGRFELVIRATPRSCPEASAELVIPLDVELEPPAIGCPAAQSCGPGADDAIDAWIDAVGPGQVASFDDLTLKTVEPGRLIFSIPETRGKEELVLNFRLPGGPELPLKPGKTGLSLRHFHGDYDDRYTFLKAGPATQFVVYRGFIPPEELEARCPNDPGQGRCFISPYARVDSDCGPALRSDQWGDLHTGTYRAEEPFLVSIGTIEDCRGCDGAPWWVEMWETYLTLDPHAEVHVLVAPAATAPTAAVLCARLVPQAEREVDFHVDPLVGGFQPSISLDGWLDMPLVGRYVVRAFCAAGDCGVGQRTVDATPARTFRVEVWTNEGNLDHVDLSVLGDPGDRWGNRVLAYDTDEFPALNEVLLTNQGQQAVALVGRIVSEAGTPTPADPYLLLPGETCSLSDF